MYKIIWEKAALKSLNRLQKIIRQQIAKKIETHLVINPSKFGKPLDGHYAGLWRYRIGDYRVIYTISQETITITIVKVGHRRDVYRAP